MATIAARLELLQGEAYYEAWRSIWQEIREEALSAVRFVWEETGGLTAQNLVELSDMLGTPFKPLVKSLEAEGLLGRGTYEALYAKGFRLTRQREQIRAEWDAAHRVPCQSEQTPLVRHSELTPLRTLLEEEGAGNVFRPSAVAA